MAKAVLEGLLSKASIPDGHGTILLINLTPYDGMVEKATRKWHESYPDSKFRFKSLSLTKNATIAQYVEKTLALELMEDCLSSNKIVRRLVWIKIFTTFRLYMDLAKRNARVLQQEWKAGASTFSNARAYEPRPPPLAPDKKVELTSFPVRLVKIECDMNPEKKGWSKYKVTIPTAIRARYMEDVIYASEWSELLSDFDKRLFGLYKLKPN